MIRCDRTASVLEITRARPPGCLERARRAAGSDPEFRPAGEWFHRPHSGVMPLGSGTMHVILAVTDHGTPRLTRYRRVIVTVKP